MELLVYLTDSTWACVRDQHGKVGLLPSSSLVDSWDCIWGYFERTCGETAEKMRHKCEHDYISITFYNMYVHINIYIYALVFIFFVHIKLAYTLYLIGDYFKIKGRTP